MFSGVREFIEVSIRDRLKRDISLRAVLLALVAIGAIPPLIFSGILLQRYAISERSRDTIQLEESAKAVARAIDSEFAAVASVLATLASLPALNTSDLGLFEYRLRTVAAKTARQFELADASGRILIDTAVPRGGGASKLMVDGVVPAVDTRRPYITSVQRDSDSGRLYARVIIPVTTAGNVTWTLHAIVEPADFARVLAQPGVPKDWIVSIVDQNGTQFVRSHKNDQFSGRPLVPELAEPVKAGRNGTLRTVTLEGIPADRKSVV